MGPKFIATPTFEQQRATGFLVLKQNNQRSMSASPTLGFMYYPPLSARTPSHSILIYKLWGFFFTECLINAGFMFGMFEEKN